MHFIVRASISFLCALAMAFVINVRLGQPASIYTVAYAAPSALFAPTVMIPLMSYQEAFRSKAARKAALNGDKVEMFSDKGSGEGSIWGIALALSFYLPFFLLPKRAITNQTTRTPLAAADTSIEPNATDETP